jgi:hypothetical protein
VQTLGDDFVMANHQPRKSYSIGRLPAYQEEGDPILYRDSSVNHNRPEQKSDLLQEEYRRG